MNELKKIEADHFEGGSNLDKGSRKRGNQHLEEIIADLQANSNILKLTSDAGSGGAATEDDNPVAGLKADDIVLSVSQKTPGANSLPLLGYADQKDGSMDFIYSADPGAGAVVEILVARPLA